MKVMMRRNAAGVLSAYVPKKDLEEPVVAQQHPGLWGGTITLANHPGLWGGTITLANGWTLALPEMADGTTLPITVEARKLSGE